MQNKQNHLYSLSHKGSKSEYRKKKSIDINYSIPCINCECFIPVAEVNKHTLLCQFSLSTQSSQIKDLTASEETDFKLKKLRLQILIQAKTETNLNDKKYLMRIEELCAQLLKLQSFEEQQYKKLLDISEEIKMLTESYEGELFIQLFLERLKSLALVKQQNMKSLRQEKYQFENYQQYQKNQDIDKQSLRVQTQQDLQEPVQQDHGYLFSTCVSYLGQNVKLRKTQIKKFYLEKYSKPLLEKKSEIFTQLSSSKCEGEIQESKDIQNTCNRNQRLFYQKCLNFKAFLLNSDPAQKVPLCILYKEVLNKRIPIYKWDEFIQSAFVKPSQYLDFKKLNVFNQPNNNYNSIKAFSINSNFKERLRYLNQV
ncbi:unnamed protein product [Paramecium octaurelia]|uniref:Uncharacterized protein n=1 Tax=Paramecium octaurelia TaxID=43137 RepID=A0A8S1TN56_PAROT|nr:unnamed protein product [Paramecium octaurelia]